MNTKKFFVIFNEARGGYWNRVTKKFKGLAHATEYEGGRKEDVENIIQTDKDLPKGYFSVKTIIRRESK